MDLAYGCGSVWRMVKYAVRVDDVERVIGEMQAFRVRNTESARQIEQVEAPFGQFNRGIREIYACIFCTRFGELSAVSSQSTTHFKHTEVFRVGKSCGRWNVPLLFITMLFYEL